MRRIPLRLAIALLTFTAGVTVAALWLPIRTCHPQLVIQNVQAPPVTREPAEAFTRVGHMSAMTRDHGCINSETYAAADGSYISFSQEDYGSPTHAAREL